MAEVVSVEITGDASSLQSAAGQATSALQSVGTSGGAASSGLSGVSGAGQQAAAGTSNAAQGATQASGAHANLSGILSSVTGMMGSAGGAAGQLGGALSGAASAGQGASSAMSSIGGSLGAIAGPAAGVAVALAAVAVSLGAIGAAQVEGLDRVGKMFGATAKQVDDLEDAFDRAGASSDTLQTMLFKIADAQAEAMKGGGPLSKAYKDLGVELLDVNGHAKSQVEVMGEVIEKLSGLTDENDVASKATDLMGSRMGLQLVAVAKNSEAVEQLARAMNDGNQQYADAAKQAEDYRAAHHDLNEAFEEFTQKASPAFITGMKALGEALEFEGKMVDAFIKEMQFLIDLASKPIEFVIKVAGGIADFLSPGGGQSFASGTPYAPGGLSLVGEQGPELINVPRGSQIYPTGQTQQMLGGGGMSINNYYLSAPNYLGSADDLENAFLPMLSRIQRRGLNPFT